MAQVLILDENFESKTRELKALAEANPVDMRELMARIKTPHGKRAHMAQMTRQTIGLPIGYVATYSVETGHPAGKCRHMSVSIGDGTKAPNPIAIWEIAKQLGFWGTIEDVNKMWVEDLIRGYTDDGVALKASALNLVQRCWF